MVTISSLNFAQDEITTTIDIAKKQYQSKNLLEAKRSLEQALELLTKKLMVQLEILYPDPLKNWRGEPPTSHLIKDAYNVFLNSQRKYFKLGGGESVDIILETNTTKIASLKRIFVNPSKVSQIGDNAKISTIKEYRCVEKYDPVDRFAELIFLPVSTLLITIRGYEMKDVSIVRKYAEKIKWEQVNRLFQ